MKEIKSTQSMSEGEIRFWERYAELLNRDGVDGKRAAYMIHRAQEFAYSLGGKRLLRLKKRMLSNGLGN